MSGPSITCPRCGTTSYNRNDIREGYCGRCYDWTTHHVLPKIDWNVTVDAFRLVGYRLDLTKLDPAFHELNVIAQCQLWQDFLEDFLKCRTECPMRDGGPCEGWARCPRQVLRQVQP